MVVSHTFTQERVCPCSQPGQTRPAAASRLLEGSVRIDGDLLRVAVRLIDAGSGAIVWSEQLDRHGTPGIARQENLAMAICTILRDYFFHD